MAIKYLLKEYQSKKYQIKQRLEDFKSVWNQPDKKIFSELCFCICTPQSNAGYCDRAVNSLEKNGALYKGDITRIRKGLRAVRFPNNKSRYIFEARDLFTEKGSIRIKSKIDTEDTHKTRLWLVKNVKGLGLKEASHFLRNIGFGRDLAILDVHILRNMVNYKVIDGLPGNISKAKYLLLEDRLRKFSQKINIPMDELDLLLWSSATGQIFK